MFFPREMKTSPRGVCKDLNALNSNVVSFGFVMDSHIPIWLGSSLFFFVDSVALYADRTQSPGKLQLSLVCQVGMPWSRLGGEWPEVR